MNTIITRIAPQGRRASLLAGALALGVAAAVAIPATVGDWGLQTKMAYAGKGNGKDNGRGGGNGGNRGGGHGYGHAKASKGGASFDGMNGSKTKLPGSLNAAHASPRALDRASDRSRVGALGAYMDAMRDYVDALANGTEADQQAALDAAAAALADAANKDHLIDAQVVDAVNAMLDGKKSGFSHTAVAGDPIHDAESEIANRINPPPAP